MKVFAVLVLNFFLIFEVTSREASYNDLMELAKLLDAKLHEKEENRKETDYARELRVGEGSEDHGDFIKVCSQEPIELALVIDSSRSIDFRDFAKGQDFLVNFLSEYDIGPGDNEVRVCAVTFGNGVYTQDAFDLNTYKNNKGVVDAVTKMPFRSGSRTDTGDAIKYMRTQQMARTRDGVPRLAIVMTDGNSQKHYYTRDEAAMARKDNITMFAIGIGNYVSDEELLNIAGDGDRIFKVSNYDALDEITEALAYKTCVLKPRPTTTTTPPPQAPPCSEEYPADIQFVFSPASLGVDATGWVTQFISHTISNEELDKGFQYGVTSGSCPADAGFPLNQYQSTSDIRSHLDRYDRNNLPELVRQTSSSAFTAENGARPKEQASRIAVVFIGKEKVDAHKLRSELIALMDTGVEVFVARTEYGIKVDLPEGVQVLHEGSSISQSAELVERICHIEEM